MEHKDRVDRDTLFYTLLWVTKRFEGDNMFQGEDLITSDGQLTVTSKWM